MKEIKVKIDDTIYKKARELGINIEDLFLSSLYKKVNEITEEREMVEIMNKIVQRNNVDTIFRVIKREIKNSKFDYVYKGLILDELDSTGMGRTNIEDILNSLEKNKVIKEEPKGNIKLLNKNYTYA